MDDTFWLHDDGYEHTVGSVFEDTEKTILS